jgi:hypothetical protein
MDDLSAIEPEPTAPKGAAGFSVVKTPRNPSYLAFLRGQNCPITGRRAQACHENGRKSKGLKPSDYLAVPLDPSLHRELHDHGRESFERKYDIDLKEVALECLHRWVTGRIGDVRHW